MKNTKGKQKVEMKEVENYKARMASFSKRKAGILKKINEMVAEYDVEVSFLAFSQAGKPHSFAHPSMEDAYDRVKCSLGLEPSGKDDDTYVGSIVEAFKRQKGEESMKKRDALEEELKMVMEMEKEFKEQESEWGDAPSEGSSVEEMKRTHQMFVELGAQLAQPGLGKDGDGSAPDLEEN